MSITRRILLVNLNIANGNAVTPAIQVPNGATKVTIQFSYSNLNADVALSMHQSLDGGNFDLCRNESDEPVTITLDHTTTSMTLNITDLLTTWFRFSLDILTATTGTINKIYVLME